MADRKKSNLYYDGGGIWPAESQTTERTSKDLYGNSGVLEKTEGLCHSEIKILSR